MRLLAEAFIVNQCFTGRGAFFDMTRCITVRVICWLVAHAQADTLQGMVLSHIRVELVVNLSSAAEFRITGVVSIDAIVVGCVLVCLRGGIMMCQGSSFSRSRVSQG